MIQGISERNQPRGIYEPMNQTLAQRIAVEGVKVEGIRDAFRTTISETNVVDIGKMVMYSANGKPIHLNPTGAMINVYA
jgi:hypothetical protein